MKAVLIFLIFFNGEWYRHEEPMPDIAVCEQKAKTLQTPIVAGTKVGNSFVFCRSV